jgi:hypothetical protein
VASGLGLDGAAASLPLTGSVWSAGPAGLAVAAFGLLLRRLAAVRTS